MSTHHVLLVSKKAKSSFKYVIHDPRAAAASKPWSVSYRGYRSQGFARVVDAAEHVAAIVGTTMVTINRTHPPAPAELPDLQVRTPTARANAKAEAQSLFGARIRMCGRPAVIKSWTPCSHLFGVVFDDTPDKVFGEDLLGKSSAWETIEWEGDIWETQDRRPICPACGHPLGVGHLAWTKCVPCGQMEPGASSTEMFSRMRTGDPYR
tara:strand:+ start:2039 stop:2662 length:624 start_codon:yes stop_codon:yes gene_type:complete